MQNIDYVMHIKRRQVTKTPTRGISSASLADKPKEALTELSEHVCSCVHMLVVWVAAIIHAVIGCVYRSRRCSSARCNYVNRR